MISFCFDCQLRIGEISCIGWLDSHGIILLPDRFWSITIYIHDADLLRITDGVCDLHVFAFKSIPEGTRVFLAAHFFDLRIEDLESHIVA